MFLWIVNFFFAALVLVVKICIIDLSHLIFAKSQGANHFFVFQSEFYLFALQLVFIS